MKKTKKLILCVTSLFLLSSCGSESGITLEKSKDVAATNNTPIIKEKRNIKLKVGIIKPSGDISPAAKIEIIFRKYSVKDLMQSVINKNKIATKPNFLDKIYQTSCKTMGSKDYCVFDIVKFLKDSNNWYTNFSDFQTEQIKESNNTQSIIVKTDLSGEGDITLEDGTWYITGDSFKTTPTVTWDSEPIKVSSTTSKIELSNDNGLVQNPLDPGISEALGIEYSQKIFAQEINTNALFKFYEKIKDN